MSLPICIARREIPDEKDLFYCLHPQVYAQDQCVTHEICRTCVSCHNAPAVLRSIPHRTTRPRLAFPADNGSRDHPPRSVAVVIPCHNYGRYLGEAIDSVLQQTRPPTEIVVVDDASDDSTPAIAAGYSKQAVRYLRVEYRSSNRARNAGLAATSAEVLCFLDADDRLAPDYLAEGIAHFQSYRVGVVYSDLQQFGDLNGRLKFPDVLQRDVLERQNMIHSGALVRRGALIASRAFELADGDQQGNPDWRAWRVLLRQGWTAVKQPALYYYRRHRSSMQSAPRWQDSYFGRAALAHETITLFVPLAGRRSQWPSLAEFLNQQSWPHAQTRLVLFDTSHDPRFSDVVRGWMAACDYTDVRHIRERVGPADLADWPRQEAADQVRLAMARIYNRLAREVATDYVWILEDDVRPPLDACRRLLEGFDEQTASVSAAYRARLVSIYIAWDEQIRSYSHPAEGVQTVGGNGFGCVVIRGHLLRNTVFTALLGCPDFDHAFYDRLRATGLKAKLDWSVACEHLGSEQVHS